MEQGKQGVLVSKFNPPQNPIEFIQSCFKEAENAFRTWLSKQSLAVEATVVTATSAAQGAAIGAFMGTLTNDVSSSLPTPPPQAGLNPQAMASFKQAQALAGGPFVQARNFAVMTGVNAGISCVMKRLRGKEDMQSSMVAAFGSGAVFTLVSGMGGPNQAANAVTSGLFFALVQGGLFKVGQKFSQPPVEDPYYVKTRSMLSKLGLQSYEKNFRKGLLTDTPCHCSLIVRLEMLKSLLDQDFSSSITFKGLQRLEIAPEAVFETKSKFGLQSCEFNSGKTKREIMGLER